MTSTAVTIAIATLIGYLSGSISGARIIGRRRMGDAFDLSATKVILDGTGSTVETYGVSPSALQAREGAAGGLRAGTIDILKALIPTLAARLVFPDGPEELFVAGAALVGHCYPVYHRFVGGYGISPLLGGLFIIDWRAPLVTIALFALLGFLAGSAFLGIETWPVALIPWFVLTGSIGAVLYAVLANGLYWWRSRQETMAAVRSYRRDTRPWRERVADFKKYPDYEVPA